MKCQYCQSDWIVKNGLVKNKQRYFCKDCGKSFYSEVEPNSIACTVKTRNFFIKQMLDEKKTSLTDIQKELDKPISKKTIYSWRTKILSELVKEQEKIILSGEIQADEIYISVSYKGNHQRDNFKLPREPKVRGGSSIRGLSKDKIAILTAIDDKGSVVAIPIAQGRPTSNQIYNVLKNNIEQNSTLITDSASSYRKLAKQLNLKLVQIPSGKHQLTVEGINYNIQRINNLHKYMRRFLSSFFGVSSKFLIYYTNWFAFIKRTDISQKQKKDILTRIMKTTDFQPNKELNKLEPINLFKAKKKTRKI